MSCIGSRPRLFISHGPKKKIISDPEPNLGSLTPDVQSNSPLPFHSSPENQNVLKLGKYVLFGESDKQDTYLAVDTSTEEEFTCKVCFKKIQILMISSLKMVHYQILIFFFVVFFYKYSHF